MRRKIKEESEALEPDSVEAELTQACGAWCFLLGLAGNAFCRLAANHEEPHQVQIESYVEPQSRFTITWELTK